jgi:hypothetical protein
MSELLCVWRLYTASIFAAITNPFFMENLKISYLLFYVVLFVATVGLVGCGSDESDPEPTKSSAKAIASFKFTALNPEVTGTVTESQKTVSATVLKGTNVTSLVPTIAISDKATMLPASGVAQNFSSPVTYTVTAEDGTKQEYVVTVVVSESVTFEVDEIDTELQQDDILIVAGSGFGAAANNKIVFTNLSTGTTYEYTSASGSTADMLYFKVAADLPKGEYSITVLVGTQSLELEQTIEVIAHSPVITNVNKTSVLPKENILITGKYFVNGQNEVFLSQDGFTFELAIIEESSTSITAKVPENIFEGDHTLSVTTDGVETYYNEVDINVGVAPTTPVITNIDKVSYSRGETIVITGTNLKKIGFASNLNFVPFISGTTMVRSGIANAAGTQVTYTIPNDFPLGTYLISVEVDFEWSEDYDEVIQIK